MSEFQFSPAGTFFCKICKQLSDDGDIPNEICMSCDDIKANEDKIYNNDNSIE